MRPLFFTFFMACSAVSFSQMITDSAKFVSLRKQLPNATGMGRIDILNDMAKYSKGVTKGWKNHADTTSFYASTALNEAEKMNYRKGMATSLSLLGSSQWLYAIPLIKGQKPYHDVLEKGERFLLRAIPIAEELNDYNLLGDIYENLSFQQYLYDDKYYRIKNFKESAKYYQLAGNSKKEGEISTWLCEDFSGRGEFEDGFVYCKRSVELAYKAVQDADTKEDKEYRLWHVWNALNDMAYVYELGGDYEAAKQYIFRANDFTARNYPSIKQDYNSLSNLNIKQGYLDSARYYLQKSTADSWGPGNELWYKISKGKIFTELKQPDSAIAILQQPYESYRSGKPSWRVLLPLAKAYYEKGNTDLAARLALESLKMLAPEQRIDLMNHYQLLSEINEATKNYDSAYYYQNRYYKLKDSIFTRQHLWQLNNYKTSALEQRRAAALAILQRDNMLQAQLLQQQSLQQQQSENQLSLLNKDNLLKDQQLLLRDKELLFKDQKLKEQQLSRQQKESALALLDKDNKLKDQQLKQQTFLRNALLAGLLLFFAFAGFTFRLVSLKQRNARLQNEKRQAELQQQSAELEMQALRAQMNPHFIFNCLSSINKFILKNESRAASDYLTRFSRLIRTVLTTSQLSQIPLSDEIEMLRLYLEMERLRFDNSFDYHIILENQVDADSIYVPPMILQPICENAIWHGLMHSQRQGKLDIHLRAVPGGIECEIADNGIGRRKAAELKSKNSDQQKSFGLKITTERLALFNGRMEHSYHVEDLYDADGNAEGTSVRLRIKTSAPIKEKEFA